MPALSLVIPCYDEARNLPDLIARCMAVAAQSDMEIILVDNGSRDETPGILASLEHDRVRSVRVEVNRGYGFGILAGLNAARGDILGWTHADLQTDPADALRGLAIFQKYPGQKIFVKGSRHGRKFSDVVFTFGMSVFETLLFAAPFRDVNAQPTLFPRALFESWKNPPHDFALDLFAYWSARRAGYAVKRFPVHFGPRGHGTQSRWNVNWQSKLHMIRRVAGYSWQLRRNFVE
ncbi:MAG: glycosyltransferase family 2 protein [Bdellovibrionales bacterium]